MSDLIKYIDQHSTKTIMNTLCQSVWKEKIAVHEKKISPFVNDFRSRRARGQAHPVVDFLFTYYSYRPGQLLKWSPGINLALEVEIEKPPLDKHFKIADKICFLDLSTMTNRQKKELVWIHDLMESTSRRPGIFKCYGLHEWAMVYSVPLSKIRHDKYPLRMSPEKIKTFLDSQKLCCSHYDAFRFFSPEAKPKNITHLSIETREKYEQPACLHTNMDLYKWAYKLSPWLSSEIIADAFLLAAEIRELDMRASPYDLKPLGYAPVKIETDQGKEEYESLQRGFSLKADSIRKRIFSETKKIIGLL